MNIRERIADAKEQELLTVDQLALLTQYSPQTIYKKAAKGEIPGVIRFGRGIRFMRVVALAWGQRAALIRSAAL